MRRIPFVLALGAAILAIAAANAESRGPYVGLYADAGHSDMDVRIPAGGSFMPFELWVWWLPGDGGLAATIHQLVTPSNVIRATSTQNPYCTVALGCECGFVNPAYCCSHESCIIDWFWSMRMPCYLLDAAPGFIEIVPCPGQPLVAANCLPGYPVEEVRVLNHLALNQDPVVSTESLSWGGIKSLYR